MATKKKTNRDGIFQKRGQFWMSYQDSRGRRHQCVLKGVISLTEAKNRRALKIAEVEKHKLLGHVPATKDSFAEWAEEFLRFQERRITAKVVKGKLSQAEFTRQPGRHCGGCGSAAFWVDEAGRDSQGRRERIHPLAHGRGQ